MEDRIEDRLADIIERIIDLIENNEYTAYKFWENRLLFIDKEQNIDLQAKLGYNNYYIKDNITNSTYIKTTKYLDTDTKIQQILIENENEKCYYSFLERDSYTSLARVIKVRGNDTIVCNNNNIVGQTWEDVLKYSRSIYDFESYDIESEDIDSFESYFEDLINRASAENSISADNYEEIPKEYIKDYTDDYDDECEDEYDNEYDEDYDEDYDNDVDNDYDYDEDESNYDDEYENSVDSEKETEQLERNKNSNKVFEKFTLYSNGQEVDENFRGRMIYELANSIEIIFDESILLDQVISDLKVVIDSKNKHEELEK